MELQPGTSDREGQLTPGVSGSCVPRGWGGEGRGREGRRQL